MGVNDAYLVTEDETKENGKNIENPEGLPTVCSSNNTEDKNGSNVESSQGVWTTCGVKKAEDKAYSYEEALNLAGNGRYTIGLWACLSLTILAMGCDMFGFSVVVVGMQCDLQLTQAQRSLLMSMPFLGAILMSYPWGYYSDTQGRRRSLLLAMAGTFVASAVSAFSPHWIMIAVLKFLSTSCCSCAQSVTYALLGESSPERMRGPYMLAMTGILMLTLAVYVGAGYFILNLEFIYDIGYITFVPWRLLILALSVPAVISVLTLRCFYESPKFVANLGREDESVDLLQKIWVKNGGKGEYPVKKLILNEDTKVQHEKIPFIQSLWQQTAPLFNPPLLWRTLQLFYLTVVMYGTNNALLMWFPFMADAFFSGTVSGAEGAVLCQIITSSQNTTVSETEICSSKLEMMTALSSAVLSTSLAIIYILMSRGAGHMKLMMIVIMGISAACGIAVVFVTNSVVSFVLFLGNMGTGLCIGLVFAYYIKLYPTSYRGMVACLGVMVARGSSLAGINLLGTYFMSHCSACFYSLSGFIISGMVVAFFLPPDKDKKR